MMKHLSLAALFAASGIAFSGTMGAVCTNGKINLSCDNAGWDLGIQALYLQPSYGDDFRFIGITTTETTREHVANSPHWSWGFKLEGAYHFNTGNDLNLNWYHLDGKKTSFYSAITFFNGGIPGDSTIAVSPRWDAVNLEFGKPLSFGESKKVRLHGGVQYAFIKTNVAVSGTYADNFYTAYTQAKYQGIGPRVGADLVYELMSSGLSVYAKAATAMLVGRSHFQRDNYNANRNIAPTPLNKTMVVPEIETKLGFNYNYNIANNSLTLDAGYLWLNYFGPQQTYYGTDPDNDFGLQGPYVGIKWVGANI